MVRVGPSPNPLPKRDRAFQRGRRGAYARLRETISNVPRLNPGAALIRSSSVRINPWRPGS